MKICISVVGFFGGGGGASCLGVFFRAAMSSLAYLCCSA